MTRLFSRLAAAVICVMAIAQAQPIRTNEGFNRNFIPRNDDGSSFLQSLGFTANFFGRQRTALYVNNNGNFTFDQPLETYTPIGLIGIRREIIAGFWADVDTRGFRSKVITYGSDTIDGHRAFGANYLDVGYYAGNDEKLNRFQIILIERADTGAGNFDIEYNYERILWETGDVSGGFFGFGGVSARVGYSNGSGLPGTSFELTGSAIPGSFLDRNPNGLIYRRLNSDVPGRIVFQARAGQIIQTVSLNPAAISFVAPLDGDPPPPQAVFVNAPNNVPFTATVGPNTPWLRVTPSSSVTPANIQVSLNTTGLLPGPYQGLIFITPSAQSGVTPQTLVVNLVVALPAADCSYAVSPGSFVTGPVATAASFQVTAPAGCLWQSTSNASFLTMTAGAVGSGTGLVNFSVSANSGIARAGTITVAGQSFAVVQSANQALNAVQICRVTTIAGNGETGNSGDNGPGATARLNSPGNVISTLVGDALIGDTLNFRIRKWTQDLIIRAFAGNGQPGNSGDGANPLAASFRPGRMALDSFANLYISDEASHVIRKIDALGRVTTVAGIGRPGFSRDGTPATEAMLNGPRGIAFGSGDVMYIADTGNHLIRTIERDGTIKTYAGTGNAGFGGDGGFASNAVLNAPEGLAFDSRFNLYIADTGNNRIRVIDAQAQLRTLAGSAQAGFAGDNGPATSARLNTPVAVAVDASGNVYIADKGNHRVRQVNPAGTIVTVGGTGTPDFNGDGTGPQTAFRSPSDVSVDPTGRVFVADTGNNRIRRIACGLGIPPDLLLPRINTVSSAGSVAVGATTPGSRITIGGENLAASTATWDDVLPGALPVETGGVRVRVNGVLAYPYAVSPQAVSVVVPGASVSGTVPVEVAAPRGNAIGVIEVAAYAPAVFVTKVEGDDYLKAMFDDGSATDGRPAAPGERVSFLATGLGPTDPPAPEGQSFADPLPVADLSRFTLTVGDAVTAVESIALIAPGLYRVAFVIPEGASGKMPVVLEAAGRRSQGPVYLAVVQ